MSVSCCVFVAVFAVVPFTSSQVQRAKRPTAHMTAYDLCWSAMGMLNYWVGDGKFLGAYEVGDAEGRAVQQRQAGGR